MEFLKYQLLLPEPVSNVPAPALGQRTVKFEHHGHKFIEKYISAKFCRGKRRYMSRVDKGEVPHEWLTLVNSKKRRHHGTGIPGVGPGEDDRVRLQPDRPAAGML